MSDYEITNFELRVLLRHYIWMQKQLPKQFATLKVKVRWHRELHRNGSSVSMKAIWILKTGHVPDDQRFWTKDTCKPLWMLSRHQAHANWLKNLVSIRRQFGMTHLKQLDFVHKKPRQDSHELTEARDAKRVEICR